MLGTAVAEMRDEQENPGTLGHEYQVLRNYRTRTPQKSAGSHTRSVCRSGRLRQIRTKICPRAPKECSDAHIKGKCPDELIPFGSGSSLDRPLPRRCCRPLDRSQGSVQRLWVEKADPCLMPKNTGSLPGRIVNHNRHPPHRGWDHRSPKPAWCLLDAFERCESWAFGSLWFQALANYWIKRHLAKVSRRLPFR